MYIKRTYSKFFLNSPFLTDVIDVPENELHWRKSNHAAILSTLPSHQRISPASNLAANLGKSVQDRRVSLHQLCSATTFYSGLLIDDEEEIDTVRRISRMSVKEQDYKTEIEDRKESIKCLTAPLHVKRKFR